jgi:hypothetical protein
LTPTLARSLDDDAAGCGCCLVWEGDVLLLGWGDVVMRIVVQAIDGAFDGALRRWMRRRKWCVSTPK